MPLQNRLQYLNGIFVNPDAMSKRELTTYAKLLSSVLKVAQSSASVLDLYKPNPLKTEDGLTGKFYNHTGLSARRKWDAVPNLVQKIITGSIEYKCEQWEVAVAITDHSKIDANWSVQSILTAGEAGQAFARRLDATGYAMMQTGINVATGATAAWTPGTATDAQIVADIEAAIARANAAGFYDLIALMTQAQKSRISTIARGIGAGITFKTYMDQELDLSTYRVLAPISEVELDGTVTAMFNPAGTFMLLDKAAYGVFTQFPTTLEKDRDVAAGLDFAFMRKFWKFQGIQASADQAITGCVI